MNKYHKPLSRTWSTVGVNSDGRHCILIEKYSLLQDLEATCRTPVGVTVLIEGSRCFNLLLSMQGFCHCCIRTQHPVTWLLMTAQLQVDQVLAMPAWQGWPLVGNENLGQMLAVIDKGSMCQLAEEHGS